MDGIGRLRRPGRDRRRRTPRGQRASMLGAEGVERLLAAVYRGPKYALTPMLAQHGYVSKERPTAGRCRADRAQIGDILHPGMNSDPMVEVSTRPTHQPHQHHRQVYQVHADGVDGRRALIAPIDDAGRSSAQRAGAGAGAGAASRARLGGSGGDRGPRDGSPRPGAAGWRSGASSRPRVRALK